jgi:transcription termination factor NusB
MYANKGSDYMKLSDAQKLLDTQKMMFRINGREEMAVAIETVLQSLEKLQDENEKLREIDFTTLYMMGVSDGKTKLENKIKKKIEELREAEKMYALDFNIGRKFLEELLKGE